MTEDQLEEALKLAHEVDACVFEREPGRELWEEGAQALTQLIIGLELILKERREINNA